jgi:hypothetical protein
MSWRDSDGWCLQDQQYAIAEEDEGEVTFSFKQAGRSSLENTITRKMLLFRFSVFSVVSPI